MPTPGAAQIGDDAMQPLGVARRQHRRRLVEDDDADVARQRLGDLHHLLVGDGQVADQPARVDVEAQPLDQGAGPAVQAAPADHARQLARKMFSATDRSGASASS